MVRKRLPMVGVVESGNSKNTSVGNIGLLFNLNVSAIAAGIRLLQKNTAYAEELGLKARQWVIYNWSM